MITDRFFNSLVFFLGWVLSPFTWWNDAFINIPLSYLIANLLFYIAPLPFIWLVIGTYWFTNMLGLFFMYLSGKPLIVSSVDRKKTIFKMVIFVALYTLAMAYLDTKGKLMPLCVFFD